MITVSDRYLLLVMLAVIHSNHIFVPNVPLFFDQTAQHHLGRLITQIALKV